MKDPDDAGYPDTFNQDGSHDLTKVRFDSYRGFLFGSINDDVVPLAEHLGDSTKVIDLLVDQSPDGLEVLRGSSTYTYDGNWKVQAENGADGYHVTAVHWNYAATTSRRGTGESANVTKTLAPAVGASPAGATGPSPTGICACGPMRPTRRTGRCGTASTSSRRCSATPRANSWSRAPATCACTRTST